MKNSPSLEFENGRAKRRSLYRGFIYLQSCALRTPEATQSLQQIRSARVLSLANQDPFMAEARPSVQELRGPPLWHGEAPLQYAENAHEEEKGAKKKRGQA